MLQKEPLRGVVIFFSFGKVVDSGPAVLLGMRSFPVVFHGFCRCLQNITLLIFGDLGAAAFSGNTFEWLSPSLVFIHLYLEKCF